MLIDIDDLTIGESTSTCKAVATYYGSRLAVAKAHSILNMTIRTPTIPIFDFDPGTPPDPVIINNHSHIHIHTTGGGVHPGVSIAPVEVGGVFWTGDGDGDDDDDIDAFMLPVPPSHGNTP